MRPVGFRSAVNVLHLAMSRCCLLRTRRHDSPARRVPLAFRLLRCSSRHFSLASAEIRFFPDSTRYGYRERLMAVRVFHPEDFWTRSVKRKEVTAQARGGGAPP